MMQGQCMCGDVQVQVAALGPGTSACHCEMCQKWTGGTYVAVHAAHADATFAGPVKTRDTSDWARRGWCDSCGSTLFYQMQDSGDYGIAAGLFPEALTRPITIEYYTEKAANGVTFAGDHIRLTTQETLAHFGAPEGE